MRVLIDGVEADEGTVSVFDLGLVRGDGCFEVIRCYQGLPFALDEHLDRLEASAAALLLELPDRGALAGWVRQAAAAGGDCNVRVMITRGNEVEGLPPRSIVQWEPLPPTPAVVRLLPLPAPWHPAGADTELAGAKLLSYAHNVASTRRAQLEGYDDALLISRDGWVLEGPTFSAGWFRDGELVTPSLELGILRSITRMKALELADQLGIPIREVQAKLEEVGEADEVFALSTVKEVAPVTAVGSYQFEPGPLTAKLAAAFADLVSALR